MYCLRLQSTCSKTYHKVVVFLFEFHSEHSNTIFPPLWHASSWARSFCQHVCDPGGKDFIYAYRIVTPPELAIATWRVPHKLDGFCAEPIEIAPYMHKGDSFLKKLLLFLYSNGIIVYTTVWLKAHFCFNATLSKPKRNIMTLLQRVYWYSLTVFAVLWNWFTLQKHILRDAPLPPDKQ